MTIEHLKRRVREIGSAYPDREQRARRLYVEERAAALHSDREREFAIRTEISEFFRVPYSAVAFCGSAQIGFSILKDKLFEPAVSDLDAACISPELFQRAWIDVAKSTRALSDLTKFGRRSPRDIQIFQDQILKRGMIRVAAMPQSSLSPAWSSFQMQLSRKHASVFRNVSVAVYMNEYAFSWKQDSALSQLLRP